METHRLLSLGVRSAVLTARLRLAGISAGVATCEGLQPVLYGDGHCIFGRVAFRSMTARPEIGARSGGELLLGNRVFINQGVSIVAHRRILIGDDCRIGDFAAIFDTDHHPVDQQSAIRVAQTRLGDNVWIGRGAIIVPGVTIGDHSVVGAGSVVTHDVPALTLVAGNPARPLRKLVSQAGWRRG
jgi:acetyltransferase-like isoleucine patch superfamily enzyme